MKVQRTLPPAAAPLDWKDLWYGLGGIFSGEKSIRRFEEETKKYFGVRYAFTVSSGKAALALILRALKTLSSKREVLIPAYTCFSVPSAVVKAGLRVRLCDIDPSTLDFDYKMLEKQVNEDTLCVVPNHLFGIPSDLDRIQALCRFQEIYVIEDAAQAMGGVYKGRKLGTIGDVGFFSFGRGKNLTCGSGGVILTNSQKIAAAIEKEFSELEKPGFFENVKELISLVLMKVFIRPALFWFPNGLPFLKLGETFFYKDFPMKRFSGMKSGLLRRWKERLERSQQDRAENGSYFVKSLRAHIPGGKDLPYLRLPIVIESVEKRNRIYLLSREKGLGLSAMYPTAINEIEEIRGDFEGESFPASKEIAERLLTVPVHAFVSDRERGAIIELINSHSLKSQNA